MSQGKYTQMLLHQGWQPLRLVWRGLCLFRTRCAASDHLATLHGHCPPGEPGLAEEFIIDTGWAWSIRQAVVGDCVSTVYNILLHTQIECVYGGLIRMWPGHAIQREGSGAIARALQ